MESIEAQLTNLPRDIDRDLLLKKEILRQLTRIAEVLEHGVPAPQIPEFNPEDLMKHKWKGKKTGEGQYGEGNLSWGWDFADKFNKETIAALEKSSITIDTYEFNLNETQTLVNAKKKKE